MSNRNQARKNAARRRAQRTGESHQAAVRATQERPGRPAPRNTRWIEDPSLDAPDGHSWLRPAPEDCPGCRCHTARVCEGLAWHRADRPTHPDGTEHTEPCPCERAEEDRPHTLAVTVGGTEHLVRATFRGDFGALYTQRVWTGVAEDGSTPPVPLVMVLAPPETAGADLVGQPRVTDGSGRTWVQFPTSQHAGRQYRITGLHPQAGTRPVV